MSSGYIFREKAELDALEQFALNGDQGAYTPCFTPGTMIKTDFGERDVVELRAGMRVLTRDNGYQPIVWAGRRDLSRIALRRAPELQPIVIKKDALGEDLPERDMYVSPQHRMLLSNAQIRQWLGSDEVLIAAHLLTCFEGIERSAQDYVQYIHFMCAQHEIVLANGTWSESYQPRDMSSGAFDPAHRRELIALFPELLDDFEVAYPAAREEVSAEAFVRALNARS